MPRVPPPFCDLTTTFLVSSTTWGRKVKLPLLS